MRRTLATLLCATLGGCGDGTTWSLSSDPGGPSGSGGTTVEWERRAERAPATLAPATDAPQPAEEEAADESAALCTSDCGTDLGVPTDPPPDCVAPPTAGFLRWLAAQQAEDGGWRRDPVDDGAALPAGEWGEGDVATTALVVLAFLEAGYTNRGDHPFARTVGAGIRWLRLRQDAEGRFADRARPGWAYEHALAALAMVEAYGMTGSVIWRGPAQRGLDAAAAARGPGGGWRYAEDESEDDAPTTLWASALFGIAARIVDHDVRGGRPPSLTLDAGVLTGARAWLASASDPDFGRLLGARPGGAPRTPEVAARAATDRSAPDALALALRAVLADDAASVEALRRDTGRLLERSPTDASTLDPMQALLTSIATSRAGAAPRAAWKHALAVAALGDDGWTDAPRPWPFVGEPARAIVHETAVVALALVASAGGFQPWPPSPARAKAATTR